MLIWLNLLIDLTPNKIGIIVACKWANNKIEKNKINFNLDISKILIQRTFLNYLCRERYHCPKTIIIIVRTKGKAGYLVWKLAGGHGDQDINLPWGSLGITFFFDFWDIKLSEANPLLIIKAYPNNNLPKGRLYYSVEFQLLFIRT